MHLHRCIRSKIIPGAHLYPSLPTSYSPYVTPPWNRLGAALGCFCRLRRGIPISQTRLKGQNMASTPSPPTKSFPTKSPWVKLSGRPPLKFNVHENSHPLKIKSLLESNPLKSTKFLVGGLGVCRHDEGDLREAARRRGTKLSLFTTMVSIMLISISSVTIMLLLIWILSALVVVVVVVLLLLMSILVQSYCCCGCLCCCYCCCYMSSRGCDYYHDDYVYHY